MGPAAEMLMAHPLFAGVAQARVDECVSSITVRAVRKGTILNGPGVTGQRFDLVLRGLLRTYQVTEDGRELLLDLVPEGGFDGVLSISGRQPHFSQAQVDSTIAEMDRSVIERLIACEPKIATNLLGLVVERLEARERQLEAVTLHDPDRQIARQLLALARTLGRRRGEHVVLDSRITHQMLADMLGVRRETVTLHLIRLTRRGVIAVSGGRFQLDLGGLARVAAGRRDVGRTA